MDAFGNITSVQEPDASQTTAPAGIAVTNYIYDVLNHLVQVSMPRDMGPNSRVTQMRTFNYQSGNSVGGLLLSATNPENGTVTYTYNADATLASKTDAKGQQFTYTYDSSKRLTQLSVVGNLVPLRTYSYDTNPYDQNYSQWTQGRLTAVQYTLQNNDTITDMLSYHQAGAVIGKRMRVARPNGTQTVTGDLDATFSYDTEGRLTSMTYPNAGPTYTYGYDSMGRLSQMTDQNNVSIVNNVVYGVANELRSMWFFGTGETRQYNSMFQVTQIAVGSSFNVQYTYSATQNNGKITSQTDLISGEQVTYTFDSLNRLIRAVAGGNTWGQGYNYDPFGNLTAKTVLYGSVPTMSVGIDPTTNRLVGQVYDANGNMNTGNGQFLSYDAENRLISAGQTKYGYDFLNKRIWSATYDFDGNLTSELYYFYAPDGKQVASYTVCVQCSPSALTFYSTTITKAYFGNRLVSLGLGHPFIQDRLQSQRVDVSGIRTDYYPYGEDKGTIIGNDVPKFATYTRDSATGLDYADQRYYSSSFGRFTTVDPFQRNGRAAKPGSWNAYAYVLQDPVGYVDKQGLIELAPELDPGPSLSPAPSGPGLSNCIDLIWDGIEYGCVGPGGNPFPLVDDDEPDLDIECEIDLQSQDIAPALPGVGTVNLHFKHTSLKVIVQIGGITLTRYLDGIQDGIYLNPVRGTQTHPHFEETPQTTLWSSGLSAENCGFVFAALGQYSAFPSNTYLYTLLFTNSNSLTDTIIARARVPLPFTTNASLAINPLYPGWRVLP